MHSISWDQMASFNDGLASQRYQQMTISKAVYRCCLLLLFLSFFFNENCDVNTSKWLFPWLADTLQTLNWLDKDHHDP